MHRRRLIALTALAVCAAAAGGAVVLGPRLAEAKAVKPAGLQPGSVIQAPGVYVLSSSFYVDLGGVFDSVVTIMSQGVILDLGGNEIRSDRADVTLIHLGSRAEDVTIRNGSLVGGATAIDGGARGRVRLENLTVRNQAGNALNFAFGDGSVRMRDVDVSGSGRDGIVVQADPNVLVPRVGGEVTLENVVVSGAGGRGVVVEGTPTFRIDDVSVHIVQVTGSGGSAVEITNVEGIKISNNSWGGGGASALVVSGCSNVDVSGCTASDFAGNGITIQGATAQSVGTIVNDDAPPNLRVTDTTVQRTKGHGIWINQGEIPLAIVDVSGNTVTDVGRVGILLSNRRGGSGDNVVTQGRIAGNVVAGFGSAVDPGASEGGSIGGCATLNENTGISVAAIGLLTFSPGDYVNAMGIVDNRVEGGNGRSSRGIAAALNGSKLNGNLVSACGDGIVFGGEDNEVAENDVHGNTGTGIQGSGYGNVILANLVSRNGLGILVVETQYGLVDENQVIANDSLGVDGGDASNVLRGNTIADNNSHAAQVAGATIGPDNVIRP